MAGIPFGDDANYVCYPDGIPSEWRTKIGNTVSGLRQRARFRGEGKAAKETELATLIKMQEFKCGVSDVILKPDKTTQLGHIVPGSRGGKHDVSNLLWITKEMNRMMGQLSVDEFVSLCNQVAACKTRKYG